MNRSFPLRRAASPVRTRFFLAASCSAPSLLAFGGLAPVQADDGLVVVGYGGAGQKAGVAFFQPFTQQTGIPVVQSEVQRRDGPDQGDGRHRSRRLGPGPGRGAGPGARLRRRPVRASGLAGHRRQAAVDRQCRPGMRFRRAGLGRGDRLRRRPAATAAGVLGRLLGRPALPRQARPAQAGDLQPGVRPARRRRATRAGLSAAGDPRRCRPCLRQAGPAQAPHPVVGGGERSRRSGWPPATW